MIDPVIHPSTSLEERHHIDQEIDEDGMATVYLAEGLHTATS